MGKIECCNCKAELGRLSQKFAKTDFKKEQDNSIVQNMSDEDRVCFNCRESIRFVPKNEEDVVQREQLDELNSRAAEYKKHWNKNGVIQFKNERIAILHRMVGAQVQFIIAFDDLTKEGYRLMTQDEGKSGSSGGISGGINSYYYFQKKELIA